MIWGFSLILLSIAAIPSLLLLNTQNAEELLEQIESSQGWIGAIFSIWGIWGIVFVVSNIEWVSREPIWWVTLLLGNIMSVILAVLLSLGVKLFSTKYDMPTQDINAIRKKLALKLGSLGVIGLFMGGWIVIASFIYT